MTQAIPRGRRPWKRAILFLTGLALISLLGVGGAGLWTSRPGFCKSCHIMGRYHASWQASKHAEVSCLLCHSAPGFLSYLRVKMNGLVQLSQCLSGRFIRRPNATVEDSSCLREGCHVREKLDGGRLAKAETEETAGTGSGTGSSTGGPGFLFRHADHREGSAGIHMRCATCHNFEEGEQHFSVSRTVCFLCHLHPKAPMREKVSCRQCHRPPEEPFQRGSALVDHRQYMTYGAECADCHMQAMRGDGRVAENTCLECHAFRRPGGERPDEIHAVHSGKEKVECIYCHEPIAHGRGHLDLDEELACTRCHADAHDAAKRSYAEAIEGAGHKSASTGSPMFSVNIDCSACHRSWDHADDATVPSRRGDAALASAGDCDRCHKPGSGRMLIDLIQGQVRGQCEAVEKEAAALRATGTLAPGVEDLIGRAEKACAWIREDGSGGLHNPDLFHRLAREASQSIKLARERLSPSDGSPEAAVPSTANGGGGGR